MAKKKKDAKTPSQSKVLTMEDRQLEYKGDLLGDKFDVDYLKRYGLYERTLLRRIRFYCFKFRFEAVEDTKIKDFEFPEGLKEFVEGLHGFAGWKYFATTWDIVGNNPFMIVLRLQSVWQQWDHVMERVAIPIDAPPEQIYARMEALEQAYKQNNKE